VSSSSRWRRRNTPATAAGGGSEETRRRKGWARTRRPRGWFVRGIKIRPGRTFSFRDNRDNETDETALYPASTFPSSLSRPLSISLSLSSPLSLSLSLSLSFSLSSGYKIVSCYSIVDVTPTAYTNRGCTNKTLCVVRVLDEVAVSRLRRTLLLIHCSFFSRSQG